jgi:hypothetical protein
VIVDGVRLVHVTWSADNLAALNTKPHACIPAHNEAAIQASSPHMPSTGYWLFIVLPAI